MVANDGDDGVFGSLLMKELNSMIGILSREDQPDVEPKIDDESGDEIEYDML